MTTRTWRISPHTDHPHTRLDRLATLANVRVIRDRLRIPCPAHGGTNLNLALWVNDDRISATCFSQGCSYRDIALAIEAKYGVSIGRGDRSEHNPPNHTGRAASPRETHGLRPHALNLWHRSVPIPKSPEHPARQWLAARHLWRPELPVPSAVRWIGTSYLHKDFKGAGAVIAMAAAPAAWTEAWPNLPDLTSVQLVYVAEDGTPARDRGLTKRTHAGTRDAVIVLGCPLLDQATGPVDVAEGLADSLALAARSPAPAVATLGTSGMTSNAVAEWLATSPATRVWADRDESKEGRAPPGQRHGRQLVRLTNEAGGNAEAVHAPAPHKDPAEAAQALGFNDLDPSWTEYARTMADMQPDWPRWEIARQAMAMCAEAE